MSTTTGSRDSRSARSNVACSFEKSVKAADSTLKQLATAKETFSDFEAFYKKFVLELNNVKEEYRLELHKFQAKIEDLSENKTKLEAQLDNSKAEIKRHKDELSTSKTKQAEMEWETEKLSRELATNKYIAEMLKSEKGNLQQEIEFLRKKENTSLSSKTVTKKVDIDKLDVMKREAEELETRYRQALQEKEAYTTILCVYKSAYQTYRPSTRTIEMNYRHRCKTPTSRSVCHEISLRASVYCLDSNQLVYKAEMQLKNITRQKDALHKQLKESQNEIRSNKDGRAALEREITEWKQTTSTYKGDIAVKARQIETLREFNQTLENQMETIKTELIPQQVSLESFAAPDQPFDFQLLDSKVQDLEKSLRSTNIAKDRLEGEVLVTNGRIIELQESNHSSQEKIRELENKLSSARHSAAALESELFTRKHRFTYLESESHDLQHELMIKLDNTTKRYADMETLFEQAVTERDECKERALFADRKVAEMKEIVREDEDINCELEEKFTNMKNQVLKMEGQSESNFKQIEELKRELDVERSQKCSIQQELLAVQNKLNETQRNFDRAKRDSELQYTD
ncbi:hypothetical protein QZH41_014449 [Actinostola sp. cb2023]|nr:hypothetical protein QZH41_014449 [Actinostola sp. cb2023]